MTPDNEFLLCIEWHRETVEKEWKEKNVHPEEEKYEAQSVEIEWNFYSRFVFSFAIQEKHGISNVKCHCVSSFLCAFYENCMNCALESFGNGVMNWEGIGDRQRMIYFQNDFKNSKNEREGIKQANGIKNQGGGIKMREGDKKL